MNEGERVKKSNSIIFRKREDYVLYFSRISNGAAVYHLPFNHFNGARFGALDPLEDPAATRIRLAVSLLFEIAHALPGAIGVGGGRWRRKRVRRWGRSHRWCGRWRGWWGVVEVVMVVIATESGERRRRGGGGSSSCGRERRRRRDRVVAGATGWITDGLPRSCCCCCGCQHSVHRRVAQRGNCRRCHGRHHFAPGAVAVVASVIIIIIIIRRRLWSRRACA